MSQRIIRLELENKLDQWNAAQATKLKIAHEGVPFTKPDTTFLEIYFIPSATVNKNINGTRYTMYGTMQINIYNKDGNGTKEAETIAQSLIDWFPVFPKTGKVSIESTGTIQNPLSDAQWGVTPVRFRYRYESGS